MSFNEEDKKILSQYEDVEGITTKKLNFGLWFVSSRSFFRTLFIGILLCISIISWFYVLYNLGFYYSRGMREDEIMVREMIMNNLNHDAILARMPVDLVYAPVDIIDNGGDQYDFLIQIRNPNERHAAEITYCFIDGNDREISCAPNFILPGQKKKIISLGQKLDNPLAVKFIIKNTRFKLIDLHIYPDWEGFSEERLKIEVSDIDLVSEDKLDILKFKAKNDTGFNYWEVVFNIIFYSRDSIVGLDQYLISNFMSGESRDLSKNYTEPFGRVSDIEIIPEINILRDDIYIDYREGKKFLK